MTNVTDYDKMTNDYSNSLSLNNNCTKTEVNIDVIIQRLFLTLPCALSVLGSKRFMVYTLIKPLKNK